MEINQQYKILNQEAYAYQFLVDVEFEYQGNVYTAKSILDTNAMEFFDVDVIDTNSNYVYDEHIHEIAEQLVYNVEINKDTITY